MSAYGGLPICQQKLKICLYHREYVNKSGISFTHQSSNGKELAFSLHNQWLM
jgi:hypothetical protein